MIVSVSTPMHHLDDHGSPAAAGGGLAGGGCCHPYITVAIFRRVAVLLLSVMDCLLGAVTSRYLLPGRSWLSGSGYGYGKEPGAVVVPAGGGLVPSSP